MSNTESASLSPADAARRLSISPITLRSWADKGLLQVQITAGGHRRYPLSEIERLLKQGSPSPSASERLMIVDDDDFMLALIQEVLRNIGRPITMETASDGFEAGRKLATFMPDIVLLDLMMPNIDGFEVCRQIKSNPATSAIRVIAMSGNPSQENIDRILSLGAESCLGKPIKATDLRAILDIAAD